jgi:hypothetical protein
MGCSFLSRGRRRWSLPLRDRPRRGRSYSPKNKIRPKGNAARLSRYPSLAAGQREMALGGRGAWQPQRGEQQARRAGPGDLPPLRRLASQFLAERPAASRRSSRRRCADGARGKRPFPHAAPFLGNRAGESSRFASRQRLRTVVRSRHVEQDEGAPCRAPTCREALWVVWSQGSARRTRESAATAPCGRHGRRGRNPRENGACLDAPRSRNKGRGRRGRGGLGSPEAGRREPPSLSRSTRGG